jgi:hypothetical protein
MLKRIAFIFISFILCGAVGFAQNIDKKTYDKLVDYCNCKYMVTYVDANLSQDQQQQALKSKLQALKDCSLNDLEEIPDFETIKQALRPDVSQVKPQARATKINKLKEKSIINLNSEDITQQILSEFADVKQSQTKFWQCKEDIKNNLENYLQGKQDNNTNVITGVDTGENDPSIGRGQENNLRSVKINKNDTIILKVNTNYIFDFTTTPKDYTPETIEWTTKDTAVVKITDANKARCKIQFKQEGSAKITVKVDTEIATETFKVGGSSWFGRMLKWLIIIALIYYIFKSKQWKLIIAFFKKEKTSPIEKKTENTEEKKKNIPQFDDFEKVFNSILNNPSYFEKFSEHILKNEQLFSLWVKKALGIPEIKKILEKESLANTNNPKPLAKEQKPEKSISEIHPTSNSSTSYSGSISDGHFNRVSETPNENTIFELHLQNANTAFFTIYEGAKQLVCKHPEFLEDCEKQVLNNAQNVKIESEGEAQRQPDGKWRITKKLSIIIQ